VNQRQFAESVSFNCFVVS